MRLACMLICALMADADEGTDRMTTRLSEEAEAFLKLAPQVIGTETLHQLAVKPPPRFRPRIGDAAKSPPAKQWNQRELISEYGFTTFSGSGGDVHELRRITSVDGKQIEQSKNAQDALARTITSQDDSRKRQLLKDFEKHGLSGAVTDFGQLILLFTRRNLERYEFTAAGTRMLGYDHALVFRYKQLDGPEAVTLFDAKKEDQSRHLKVDGEICVRENDFLPLQIRMVVREGEGASGLMEEAAVDYAMSRFGALLPTQTEHREKRGQEVVAENAFRYAGFHKFEASSDIKFEVEP
jgi:hypothetical protein